MIRLLSIIVGTVVLLATTGLSLHANKATTVETLNNEAATAATLNSKPATAAAVAMERLETMSEKDVWFGHVRVGKEHAGLVRYDVGTAQWTVAFADRFGYAPWEYFGYSFFHAGEPVVSLKEATHYDKNGMVSLEGTPAGVVVSIDGLRLLVAWEDIPDPDPLVELEWALEGNEPMSNPPAPAPVGSNAVAGSGAARSLDSSFFISDEGEESPLNDENCPGGYCWCIGPQGVGYACCAEGQVPFCKCDDQESGGGCRKKPTASITLLK